MDANLGADRAYIRLRLNEGIKAELGLLDNEERLLTRSTASVLLINISQEGLSFLSGLKLPADNNYMVDFQLRLVGVSLNLRGHVVWRENRDNQYEYGVAFHPPNKMKIVLIRMLNQEMLRQSPEQHKIHQLYRKINYRSL